MEWLITKINWLLIVTKYILGTQIQKSVFRQIQILIQKRGVSSTNKK